MAQLRIETLWRDAAGEIGRVSLHVRDLSTVNDALNAAQDIVSAVDPLCSAVNFQATAYIPLDISQGPAAQEGSNIYDRAFFIFRDGPTRGVISVPAPNDMLFELGGSYRAIRITRERLAMLGLLSPLESAVSLLAIPGWASFPATFVVGGRQGLTL